MDKYTLASKVRKAGTVDREAFVEERCRGKVVLDMGCIRHCAEAAINNSNWLHAKIKSVAEKTVGVDFLPREIEKLKAHGYDIVLGDVTKPLPISDRFDIIVAGDLIEHLTNFTGFFENCSRLLKSNGEIVVSTPNPFYCGEFHFVALKGNYLINPEHTCWIDPQALNQLSQRFGFVISEIHFIKKTWKLKHLICVNEHNEYDILQDIWLNSSFYAKLRRRVLGYLFQVFYMPFRILSGANTKLVRYSDYLAVLTRS